MSASTTSVDIQGMSAAQASFQQTLDTCNTAYNNMTEQQQTLAANWTGEAASSFGMALEQYMEDFSVVRQQLSTILETLSTNTGMYANTSDGSTQLAQVFGHGLPGLTGI